MTLPLSTELEQTPAANNGSERRQFTRHACDLEIGCEGLFAEDGSWSAQVRDLSAGGIGLVLDEAFERGSALFVELPAAVLGHLNTVPACVMHSRQQEDGRYFVGCEFVYQLSEDELRAILKSATTPAQ